MAKKVILDMSGYADCFFEDSLFVGINTQLNTTEFCHLLDDALGFNFKRDWENSIQVKLSAGKQSGYGIAGTLFEDIPLEEEVHFGCFYHNLVFTQEYIRLFCNYQAGHVLVPEFKQFKFFIYLNDANFSLHHKTLDFWLQSLVPHANSTIINTQLLSAKSKEYFIL